MKTIINDLQWRMLKRWLNNRAVHHAVMSVRGAA